MFVKMAIGAKQFKRIREAIFDHGLIALGRHVSGIGGTMRFAGSIFVVDFEMPQVVVATPGAFPAVSLHGANGPFGATRRRLVLPTASVFQALLTKVIHMLRTQRFAECRSVASLAQSVLAGDPTMFPRSFAFEGSTRFAQGSFHGISVLTDSRFFKCNPMAGRAMGPPTGPPPGMGRGPAR